MRYEQVHPGIDIEFYGTPKQLEYDVVVRPGADASNLEFRFSEGAAVDISWEGDLVITTRGGTLRQHKPVAYQQTTAGRVPVPATFERRGDGIGFQAGPYDRSRPLVIDPTVTYSSYIGDSQIIARVAVDESSGIYAVAGYLIGQTTSLCKLYKLNLAGNAVLNTQVFGGTANTHTYCYAIVTSPNGDVHLAGATTDPNLPVPGAFQPTIHGGSDGFLMKLHSDGTIVYGTYFGGSNLDGIYGMVVTPTGEAIITGSTASTDLPLQNAILPVYSGGPSDLFLARFAANGSSLVFSTYFGGTGDDSGDSLALDPAGYLYVTGGTDSPNFPTYHPAPIGNHARVDGFLMKWNLSPLGLVYSTVWGGSNDDYANGVAVDSSGRACICGSTNSSNFPQSGAQIQGGLAGPEDGFVSCFKADGSPWYSRLWGGSGRDGFGSLWMGAAGEVYLAGFTLSPDFPTDHPPLMPVPTPFKTLGTFVTFAPDGTKRYSSTFGGSYIETIGMAGSSTGVYIGGASVAPDLPTTPNAQSQTFIAPETGFLMKIDDTSDLRLTCSGYGFKSGSAHYVTFEYKLANLGENAVDGVVVGFNTPQGATLTSYTSDHPSGTFLTSPLRYLAGSIVGASAPPPPTYTIRLTYWTPGSAVTSSGRITQADQGDPNTQNNSCAVTAAPPL